MSRLDQAAWAAKLADIDRAVRGGRHSVARVELQSLPRERIPRNHLVEFAALARRLSLPLLGLSALHRLVRPPATEPRDAKTDEIAEYAACLIRIGVTDEALALLDEMRPEQYPQSLIFKSLAFTSRWDYAGVARVLREYLALGGGDSYQCLIARANLAQAFVYLEEAGAMDLINETLRESERQGAALLRGNLLMLKAVLETQEKSWRAAEQTLAVAASLLGRSETIDAYLIRKQQAVLDLHRSKGRSTIALLGVRREAYTRRHWESVRDCDFHLAVVGKDRELARHLYFGTPYEFYRKRIAKQIARVDLSPPYLWKLGKGRIETRLDLAFTAEGFRTHHLKLGQVPHRLLMILASDFYRPQRPMEIFAKLFPGEYYSPASSKDRFYQACQRLRNHLRAEKIPLGLNESHGFYHLEEHEKKCVGILTGYGLSAAVSSRSSVRAEVLLEKFWQHHSSKATFTVREFARALELSERTASRILNSAREAGLILAEGAGPKTKYRGSAAHRSAGGHGR